VLVGGLGQAEHIRLLTDSLTIGDYGIRFLDGNAGMVLLQVLQTDLQVQLPSPCDDVLPGLLNDALHHRVRLGQPFQTLH